MKTIKNYLVLSLAVLSLFTVANIASANDGIDELANLESEVLVLDADGSSLDNHFGYVACRFRNRRGQVFEAVGRDPHRVTRRAEVKCYQHSIQCRFQGCRRIN